MQGQIQEFYKGKGGGALKISDAGGPSMVGDDMAENFENWTP